MGEGAVTALLPSKWSFSTKKNKTKPMRGQHLYFRARQQDLMHEGQRRSALTQIPLFGGLGRTGGRRFGAGRLTGISGAVSPHTGRRSSRDSLWGTPSAAPSLGAPRGDPRPPQAAPGDNPTRRGDSQPQQPRQGTPPKPRSEATPGRAASAARGKAAQTRHSGPRLSPHGGATWYLPPPPRPQQWFHPPRLTHREGRGLPPDFPHPSHPYS